MHTYSFTTRAVSHISYVLAVQCYNPIGGTLSWFSKSEKLAIANIPLACYK